MADARAELLALPLHRVHRRRVLRAVYAMRPAKSPHGPWCDRPGDASRGDREEITVNGQDDQAQRDWEDRWNAMTPDEKAHEIQLMDEHVAFWENKGDPA